MIKLYVRTTIVTKKKKKSCEYVPPFFFFYYLFMKICNFISLKIWFLTSKTTCLTTIFFFIWISNYKIRISSSCFDASNNYMILIDESRSIAHQDMTMDEERTINEAFID